MKGSENLNERMKELRKKEGLTLKRFGERLGVSEGAISNLEKGNRNITEQMFKSICREFNVNEEWFRSGIGDMYIETDEFNLDEYAKSKGATASDIELIKSYLNIPKEIREIVLNTFKKTLLSDKPYSFSEEDGQGAFVFEPIKNSNTKDKKPDSSNQDYIKNSSSSASTMMSTALNTIEKEKYQEEINQETNRFLEQKEKSSTSKNSKNA